MCNRGVKWLRVLVITGVLFQSVTAAVADHPLFQAIRRDQTDLLASLLRQGTPVSARRAGQSAGRTGYQLVGERDSGDLPTADRNREPG